MRGVGSGNAPMDIDNGRSRTGYDHDRLKLDITMIFLRDRAEYGWASSLDYTTIFAEMRADTPQRKNTIRRTMAKLVRDGTVVMHKSMRISYYKLSGE